MSVSIARKRWAVCGPEIGEVVPVCDDGTGPMEYGRDYVEVEADTKREALVKGLRAFRTGDPSAYMGRHSDWWQEGGNPFSGMTAEFIEPCQKHGYDFATCETAGCYPEPADEA